ncbi:MAG: hypothetical protein IAI50_03420 [Candidatus Eremiobacteraeota bacterium]|nr:hypothetical protein [Candidatus Eremiobacteraeota bacterium]
MRGIRADGFVDATVTARIFHEKVTGYTNVAAIIEVKELGTVRTLGSEDDKAHVCGRAFRKERRISTNDAGE